MARISRRKGPLVTKKHLARQQREQLQTRWIIIGTAVVLLAVVALVIYGVLNERLLKGLRPVAVVNGEKITTRDFQAQVRFQRRGLVQSALQAYQFREFFGSSPDGIYSILSQLYQVQSQMEPSTLGQQVLDQMIEDKLIRQEAQRRGITVSEDEIQAMLQEAFGYFPQGTPTPKPTLVPQPTSTLSPLQMTLTAPTPTPTATLAVSATATLTPSLASPTPTLTATPAPTLTPTLAATPTQTLTPTVTPTPTPYTFEAYQERYKQYLETLKGEIGFSEGDLRYVAESQLYRRKVMEAVLAELGVQPKQEQVWARHILVAEQSLADIILQRLKAGEDWYKLAAEFSTDESNKFQGGDLGWFARGRMVKEFEDAAFSLQVGEIVSKPVQTSFGWHIIQVLGHEERPLNESEYERYRQQRFDEWLQDLRQKSQVEIREGWVDLVPTEPALPQEVLNYMQVAQQQLQQLTQPTPAPETSPTPQAAP